MTNRKGFILGAVTLVCAAAAVPATSMRARTGASDQAAAVPLVVPHYGDDGALQLPQDWRRWVFVGSSLGLSYAPASQSTVGAEMFHETLMEPTAYQHFVDTGTFREGTQFVLLLHQTGEGVLPSRRGRFASEVHGVEMAVKDSKHRAEGWAYYNFGGRSGLRDTAQAMPKDTCFNCHAQHAKRDNVFLQFYPLLEGVAPQSSPAHAVAASVAASAPASVPASAQPFRLQPSTTPQLAIRGLDPVLLVAGQEEMGKPEIVAVHKAHRYQFVSEPNRVKFEKEPQRFSFQNDACLVVPGAPLDPSLFAVHGGKLYGLATEECVLQFKARPSDYVQP